MRNEVSGQSESGCLIYDSHCRLCVAVKRKLAQRSAHIEFVPYDSRKAADCLGKRYHTNSQPSMAYWVDEKGKVVGGLEAFLPLISEHRIGKIFMYLLRFSLWRKIMLGLYQFVAKHRYRWFGTTTEPG